MIYKDYYYDTIYALALVGREIVGFIASYPNSKDYFIEYKPLVEVCNVYIKPKYRNMGIAYNLINKTIDWWKDKDEDVRFSLYVFSDNINAVKLYKKLGFKDYYLRMIM